MFAARRYLSDREFQTMKFGRSHSQQTQESLPTNSRIAAYLREQAGQERLIGDKAKTTLLSPVKPIQKSLRRPDNLHVRKKTAIVQCRITSEQIQHHLGEMSLSLCKSRRTSPRAEIAANAPGTDRVQFQCNFARLKRSQHRSPSPGPPCTNTQASFPGSQACAMFS